MFWFLVIVSGGYLLEHIVAIPETAQTIVDDGSTIPAVCWGMTVIQCVVAHCNRQSTSPERGSITRDQSPKLSFPNPLKSLAILREYYAVIIVLYLGLLSFSLTTLMTSTANQFSKLYNLGPFKVGLCFLYVILQRYNGS